MTEIELKDPSLTNEVPAESEISNVINMNNICRLCANENEKLIGIFTEDGLTNDLANKMNLYLPVKVSESDQLPLQCCWQCASTVLAWHDLVVTSVEADRRLRHCDYVTLKGLEYDQEANEPVSGDENAEETTTTTDVEHVVTESFSTTLNAFCQNEDITPTSDSLEEKFENEYLIENTEDIKTDPNEVVKEQKFIKPDDEDKSVYNFRCQYCPMLFVAEDEILKHVKDEHKKNGTKNKNFSDKKSNSKRPQNKIDRELVNAAKVVVDGRIYYNCKQCGKSLHSPYTYVWHMRIHTGERPFVCDLCGKQFRVSQGLIRHLRETHERIRNFPCDLCGRMFATKRNVEEHRRIHTNERPYICDLCGKAFKQKASLFVHNRSHSDLFPFKCSYCAQGFRTKPPLLIHITRHTGEKPYPCDICGRCFRIKYELKRHRLIHSDEKPFSCDECGLSFRQKRYLRNHLKLNHQLCDG